MKSEVRLTIEFLAGVFITMFILLPMGIDSDLGGILSFIGGIAFTALIEISVSKGKKNAKNFVSYNSGSNTLVVKGQDPSISSVIKIEEMVNYSMNYHPSQIVYTGATVGGVHTGGFHDAGNYYSLDGSGTKKYQLIYTGGGFNGDEYCPIRCIKCTPGMIANAKKHPVLRNFITSADTLTLENKVPSKYAEHYELAAKQKNTDLFMQMAKADYFNQQLSKTQCQAVKDWICS